VQPALAAMDSGFSATIRVSDLNDYIAPSQDCVVALNGKLKVLQVRLGASLPRFFCASPDLTAASQRSLLQPP
jgi:hypothetical protein